MEHVLQGIPGTACYLDDLLIASKNHTECYTRVEQALQKLSPHSTIVNKEKCKLFQSRVRYLGYELDSNGLCSTADKVGAILKVLEPTNVTQLKAVLGLINFYAKVLPDLATVLKPFHSLLSKSVRRTEHVNETSVSSAATS